MGRAAGHGTLAAAIASGGIVALLSAGVNNLPGLLLGILGIDGTGLTGSLQHLLVFGAIIGADIGPKLTPIGSLATLIWLHYLQYKGIAPRITRIKFIRGLAPFGRQARPLISKVYKFSLRQWLSRVTAWDGFKSA